MSWLFSRVLVEECSAASCSGGVPFAPSNSIPTPQAYLSPDRMTEFSRRSLFGMTFAHLTESRGEELLTWFLVGFRVKTSQSREMAQDLTAIGAGCGRKCDESLAKFDRDSCSWKTHQLLLFGGGGESLQIWPRWATWDATGVWVDSPWDHAATESACGSSLIRPTAQSWMAWKFKSISNLIRKNHSDGNIQEQSARCFRKMITPISNEIVMKWPEGWTDLKPLEMGKFQHWQQQHSRFCTGE